MGYIKKRDQKQDIEWKSIGEREENLGKKSSLDNLSP